MVRGVFFGLIQCAWQTRRSGKSKRLTLVSKPRRETRFPAKATMLVAKFHLFIKIVYFESFYHNLFDNCICQWFKKPKPYQETQTLAQVLPFISQNPNALEKRSFKANLSP